MHNTKIEDDFTNQHLFDKIYPEEEYTCVFPVEPELMNKRFYLQQGIYLCPGRLAESFMKNLTALRHVGNYVEKIIIPESIRLDILENLNYMNIHSAALFPDLEGYSKSIYSHFELAYSSHELEQRNKLS